MRALGDREALRYHNGYRTWRISYRELYQRIGFFSCYLEQRGLCKGDRVLLWGENRPEWVYAFWGCLARGVAVVPLDYRFSRQLVERIQQEVGARLLVSGDEVDASGLDVDRMPFAEVAGQVAGTGADRDFEITTADSDAVVEIVYTSGTTGEPKGVVHRHRNISSNLASIEREVERYLWLARPFQPIRFLDLLPLSHLFGQSTGLFVPVMLGGAAVFTSDLSPGALIETVRRERVSVLIGVPRMLASLRQEIERNLPGAVSAPRRRGLGGALESWLNHRRVHARLGWKFWALVVGGAPLGRDLEDFWRWLGFAVVQGYGLTEASPVIAVNHPFRTRRGSIGAALAGQEIRLAPDGEILVRGPSVVHEYFSRPQASAANSDSGASGDSGGSGDAGALTDSGALPDSSRRAPLRPAEEAQRPQEPVDGWLHTGDIAEMDAEGNLYYRGRKKEIIVRPDGLNVYPQDVEAVLNRVSGVKESAVVGIESSGGERIHAAVILHTGGEGAVSERLEAAVRQANSQLEVHQRIQSWSLWPEEDFPRTASTLKVRRAEVAQRVAREQGSRPAAQPARGSGLQRMLAEITGRDAATLTDDQRLDEDLGLSSLERVELMAMIENQRSMDLDEERFAAAATVGELRQWLREGGEESASRTGGGAERAREGAPQREPGTAGPAVGTDLQPAPLRDEPKAGAPLFLTQPRWARALPFRLSRAALLDVVILPMVRELVRLRVEGIENLAGVSPPVIFVANHTSHFDTAVIYCALARPWRRRLAPAMSQDFFRPLFEPQRFPRELFWKATGQFLLACGLFNAYPLPQKMGGTRRALRYTGELIDRGYCPLVFPEGERSSGGGMLPFKSGIGLMARRLGVPVVPIHLQGVYEIYSMHHEWPQPGRVTVRVGPALRFAPSGDYLQAARVAEQAVLDLRPGGEQ